MNIYYTMFELNWELKQKNFPQRYLLKINAKVSWRFDLLNEVILFLSSLQSRYSFYVESAQKLPAVILTH